MRARWFPGALALSTLTACAGLLGITEAGDDAGALGDASPPDDAHGGGFPSNDAGFLTTDAGFPPDSMGVLEQVDSSPSNIDAADATTYDATPFICPSYDAAVIPWAADAGEAGSDLGEPPVLPAGAPATTATTPQNFALHHIHLGDEVDPVYGYDGWKAYGYNIDGLDTTDPFADNSCTPGPESTDFKGQVDGPSGLDNSFGQNLAGPLLSLLIANPSQNLDDMLAAGQFSFLIDVTGLSGAPGQTASGLSGSLFAGVLFTGVGGPTFTTADNWAISSASVLGPIGTGLLAQPICAATHFAAASVVSGTFVSGTIKDVQLTLTFDWTITLTLPIDHAIITFRSPGDAGAGQAAGGIIAGVINAQKLIAAFEPVFAASNACGSVENIVPAIEQAADILDDGTNVPGSACTAVSIGIGFDADEIAQPTIAGTPSQSPGCDSGAPSDAGTGSD